MYRTIPLQLWSSLPPTTHGKVIACDYYVSVTLKTGRFISDLKLRVGPAWPSLHTC